MSKEFHVFTHQDTQYEQQFVFEIERHEDDESVEFKDLYLVTTTQHGEIRTRIVLENMIQSIIRTEGGNIDDSSVKIVVDMFKDLIPKEKQLEIEMDLDNKEILNIDPEELIKASEYALIIQEAERVDNETRGPTHKI